MADKDTITTRKCYSASPKNPLCSHSNYLFQNAEKGQRRRMGDGNSTEKNEKQAKNRLLGAMEHGNNKNIYLMGNCWMRSRIHVVSDGKCGRKSFWDTFSVLSHLSHVLDRSPYADYSSQWLCRCVANEHVSLVTGISPFTTRCRIFGLMAFQDILTCTRKYRFLSVLCQSRSFYHRRNDATFCLRFLNH